MVDRSSSKSRFGVYGRADEVIEKGFNLCIFPEKNYLDETVLLNSFKQGAFKIALKYKNANDFLYLGRGLNFPVALEGALKLKEISYIHAEGYPAAEMKHGPIALVDKDMPNVFIVPKDKTYDKIISNIEEIKSREGKIIIVTDSKDKILKNSKIIREAMTIF